MSERADDIRLQTLRDSGIKLYSISRLNSLNNCQYGAYMNYIEHKEQLNPGIYGILGGRVHDVLEGCIHGENITADILDAINKEMEDMDLMGIEFPKDRNGNDSIRNNWLANMNRFAKEFKIPKGKFETEQLLLLPIDDKHYMMGYADLIRHNSDGTLTLLDWKTSSQFTKDHLIEAGRQLIVYKLALEYEGYTVPKCAWIMLKYCETTWIQKNGKPKNKVSEWRNLIRDLEAPIEKALVDLGYDETDIECMLHEAKEKNNWEPFPQEIKDKFKTHIYVREYEITDELIEETLSYIKDTINKYETLEEWEPCNIDKNSYFCNALCGYGGKTGQCKYYVEYLDQFIKDEQPEDDMFS